MGNDMVKEHTPGASIVAGVAACLVALIHQSLLLLMEESMKVNGRMECIMVMEHILFLMVASMKGVGRVVKCGTEYITTIKEPSLGNR